MKASTLGLFRISGLGVSSLIVSGLVMTAEGAIAQNICASATTQRAINQCATQARQQADQNLTDFIADYQTRLSAEQVVLLQHTQESWKLFRRFSCEFESSGVAGGSAYPAIFSNCIAAKATARLNELQQLAQCEEGDLSCPAREIPRSQE
ncbi:MAG: DUF1311 domain-containing protein [Timaviella obliquedivisa GSE-PSE-MK23-08B]|jgi:uncharacterized protein YecT (DUF1311 family)|nr:DUF1311 domain-containing protein [Timaviella obliquedivisa GSE-PSE-MK23-08B]